MVRNTLFIAAAVLGITLGAAGCNRQEPAGEVREDVADAQQEANENGAEQQADSVAAADGTVEDRAEADYDVAIAKADGDRKVAAEACEALSSDAQENCKRQAEQQYDSAKAQAQAQLDAARNGNTATTTTPGVTDSTGTATTGATGGATDTNDTAPKTGG
jgi:hypothetical protein